MARAGTAKWWVSCLLLAVGGTPAWSAPDVSQMLSYKPKQEGVAVSTPSEKEISACKVEAVQDEKSQARGWLLRDPKGLPLRRFLASNGQKFDISSYYQDGVEVYREIDADANGRVYQYRWLNAGGSKWGVDTDEDGTIDTWKMISPEEVSQEVLQAVLTQKFARLQALMITDEELNGLKLPSAETTRLRELKAQSAAKFQSTLDKLKNLGPQTHWVRLEASIPQCLPAEQLGKPDLIKYTRSALLYENGGKHDWLQIGEIIQVGSAWRIVDAPVPGDSPDAGGQLTPTDPVLQGLVADLTQLDAQQPKVTDSGPNPAVVTYNMKRAEILTSILGKVKAEDRDQWTRQVADCYNAAALASPEGEKTAVEKLSQLEQEASRNQPGSPLAGYIQYRLLAAEYTNKLSKSGPDSTKVLEQWLGKLTKFVQDNPKADDTPDALLQLGMGCEFQGKEPEARKWYQQLVSNYADKKPFADKAQGALRRLDLEGKPLELSANTVDGKSFDISQLQGKVVVVYYWASTNQQAVGDFARLKLLLNKYGSQGLEVVSVNLDNSPPEASAGTSSPAVGIQVFHPAGQESPLAVNYGIMVLPNLFLVGKDGKVISRTVQLANLEDEVKKAVK